MSQAVRGETEEELLTGLPPEAVLHTLGVLPEGASLEDVLVDATAEAVLGFYDPETKRLVVESRAGTDLSPLAQTTLVHEVTHAITDQHFDLAGLVGGDTAGDPLSATLGLIEGDAMFTMQRWSRDHFTLGDQFEAGMEAAIGAAGGTAAAAPPVISEIQAAPYLHGMTFVGALHEEGGWAAVDAAYRNPPSTTEQILHPAKYLAREVGEDVSAPPAPAGATRVQSGTLGELFIRAWLSGGAGALIPGAGSDAASGWDGDAYTSWVGVHGGNLAVSSRWDSAQDARGYRAAVLRWFESEFGPARPSGDRWVGGAHCLRLTVEATAASLELSSGGCPG